jgi:hypothetical protein
MTSKKNIDYGKSGIRLLKFITDNYPSSILEAIKSGEKIVIFNGQPVVFDEKFRDRRVKENSTLVIQSSEAKSGLIKKAEKVKKPFSPSKIKEKLASFCTSQEELGEIVDQLNKDKKKQASTSFKSVLALQEKAAKELEERFKAALAALPEPGAEPEVDLIPFESQTETVPASSSSLIKLSEAVAIKYPKRVDDVKEKRASVFVDGVNMSSKLDTFISTSALVNVVPITGGG